MKSLLLLVLGGLFLTSCQATSREVRQRQPRQITSEVDSQPQRIAPSSL